MEVVKELLKAGADISKVNTVRFQSRTLEEIGLFVNGGIFVVSQMCHSRSFLVTAIVVYGDKIAHIHKSVPLCSCSCGFSGPMFDVRTILFLILCVPVVMRQVVRTFGEFASPNTHTHVCGFLSKRVTIESMNCTSGG